MIKVKIISFIAMQFLCLVFFISNSWAKDCNLYQLESKRISAYLPCSLVQDNIYVNIGYVWRASVQIEGGNGILIREENFRSRPSGKVLLKLKSNSKISLLGSSDSKWLKAVVILSSKPNQKPPFDWLYESSTRSKGESKLQTESTQIYTELRSTFDDQKPSKLSENSENAKIYLTILIGSLTFLCLLLTRNILNYKRKLNRFKPIFIIEDEVERLRTEKACQEQEIEKLNALNLNLSRQYQLEHEDKKKELSLLKSHLDIINNEIDLIDVVFYSRRFADIPSIKLKEATDRIIDNQKRLIKDKKAVFYSGGITWNNSEKKGTALANKIRKLALRAFNGECDVLIRKLTAKNIESVCSRIEKSAISINKLIEGYNLTITSQYIDMKIQEAQMLYEYKLNTEIEKELEREERIRAREEEKAEKELQDALKAAEREEEQLAQALEIARREIEASHLSERGHLETKIKELELKLLQNNSNVRNISQAQLTKRGHIYVISNVGAFGEGVYKIGMTRRLNPSERIRELSSASVPFRFFEHGMIKVENAPQIENAIHQELNDYRVNRINMRKEFFRVPINIIESVIRKHCGDELDVRLIHDYEADEYLLSQDLK